MTTYTESFFQSADGRTDIHVNHWTPEGDARGVVQIAHGVAEYGKRYDAFARFLCDHGFAVVANDHLGHGQSRIADGPMVYFGEQDGWRLVVDDIETLRRQTAERYPGVPYILFGHSMGSFLSRTHLIRYPGKLSGCILCGTGQPPAVQTFFGKRIADREIKKLGKAAFSPLADKLAFGSYNKTFAGRTRFDWLSANEANVDAYIADPLCGGDTSLGLFRDLLDGLALVTGAGNLAAMDKALPVLFISGAEDPVGAMGKGVKAAVKSFRKAGMTDVRGKLYPGLRHEILNEEKADVVCRDVLAWLDDRFPAGKD